MPFRPGPLPTLMVLLALPILVGLGTWQVQRLAWKTELIDTLATRQAEVPVPLPPTAALGPSWTHRPVTVTATLVPTPALRFGTFGRGGAPGHLVLQRAVLDDGRSLVVARGWWPERADVRLETPEGRVPLQGSLLWLEDARPSWLTPENDPAANRWFRYDQAQLEAAFDAPILPVALVLKEASTEPGTPVPQPVVADLPNNHLGYAITWYGLAVALVVVYVVYGWRRERSPR